MSDEDEEIDDEAVAAEWAAMAEADEDEDGGGDDMATPMGTDRVLDQGEIDSLLGFDGDDESESTKTGVQALINSGLVAYERLPMLDIIFDRYDFNGPFSSFFFCF